MRYDLLQEVPLGVEMLASRETTNYHQWIKLGQEYFGNSLLLTMEFPSCVATQDGTRTGTPILKYRDMQGSAGHLGASCRFDGCDKQPTYQGYRPLVFRGSLPAS